MLVQHLCFVFTFVFLFQGVISGTRKDLDDKYGKTVFTNILYRHGDRTPLKTFPKDPVQNWPEGWGQLTLDGKKHHFLLGKWLRETYGHLLKPQYDLNEIVVRSTDVDRTLMSALANTAGLYAPSSAASLDDNIKWMPVPIHTTPETLDDLIAMKAPCKKYEIVHHKFRSSKQFADLTAQYGNMCKYLETVTGEAIDVSKLEYLFTTLGIEDSYGKAPAWYKGELEDKFPGMLKKAAAFDFMVPTYLDEMKRLKGGPLLKAWLGNINKKVKSIEKNKKFVNVSVYSGHDTTVSALLNTIGVLNQTSPEEQPYGFIPPEFSAMILFELRQKDNKNIVTVLYKRRMSEDEPVPLIIPGCTEAGCPLDTVNKLLAPMIPENWISECHQHTPFDLSLDQPYDTLAVFAMVTSTLIVFVLLASTSIYWHKQKPSHNYKKLKIETL